MSKITSLRFLVLAFLSFFVSVNAQKKDEVFTKETVFGEKKLNLLGNGIERCSTVEYEAFLKRHFPERLSTSEFEAWLAPLIEKAQANKSQNGNVITIPVVVHVIEVTQPQGHSTSGSHERYKNEERLKWESEFDCINKFKEWILNFDADGQKLATEEELAQIAQEAKAYVNEQKKEAWALFTQDLKQDLDRAVAVLENLASESPNGVFIKKEIETLQKTMNPIRKDVFNTVRKVLRLVRAENSAAKTALISWLKQETASNYNRYSDYLYSNSENSALKVQEVAPTYGSDNRQEDGRIILRDNFKAIFEKYPESLIFGEDAGKIGGMNQSLEGLQEEFGTLRVSDVGIRECTIIGQGIGMAMRGLRPIAEIQYLDYLLYGIQIMSDDLATVQYRTKGGQKAPLIVSTRGHRLEGIWHSGSPMGMIINAIRGIHVLVPRDMTQAAGFYNTLLECDEPALVIECLNGYRLKEKTPLNFGEFKTPIGVVETLRDGSDITLVSYGSTLRLVMQAANELAEKGIECEVIDIQSLLPFDVSKDIVKSVAKTNRLLVIDEDVPGGASAFILQQILEEQDAYKHLDSKPQTLAAKAHRAAYGTDGDYFSKPSAEDIYEKVYDMMHEVNPSKYPALYQ